MHFRLQLRTWHLQYARSQQVYACLAICYVVTVLIKSSDMILAQNILVYYVHACQDGATFLTKKARAVGCINYMLFSYSFCVT